MKKIKFIRVVVSASLWSALPVGGCSSGGGSEAHAPAADGCASLCEKLAALKCPNDMPGSCVTQCQESRMTTKCKAEYDAVLACAMAPGTFSCVAGQATLVACDAEALALARCDARGGTCEPKCSSATCQNPGDQCGGQCPGVCANGQSGCKTDINCQTGSVCLAYPDGTTACLPGNCAFRVLMPPLCGLPGAECGETCPTCTPRCEGRTCGPDPNCGQSCGSCATGEYCGGARKSAPPRLWPIISSCPN